MGKHVNFSRGVWRACGVCANNIAGGRDMQIDLIFKIASIGIVVAILNQVLIKVERSEYAVLTTLMGIIAVLFILIPEIEALFESVKTFIEY